MDKSWRVQNDRLDFIASRVIATCHVQEWVFLLCCYLVAFIFTVHPLCHRRFNVYLQHFLSVWLLFFYPLKNQLLNLPLFYSWSIKMKWIKSLIVLQKLLLHNRAGCGKCFRTETEIDKICEKRNCLECCNNSVLLSCIMQNHFECNSVPFASKHCFVHYNHIEILQWR